MHMVPKVDRCSRWRYRVNCVGGMLEGSLITYIVMAVGWRRCNHENLRWWHARKRRIHEQRVSNGLRKVWPWKFMWASRVLYKLEVFDQRRKKKKSSFKIRTSAPVRAAQPASTLCTLPIRTFWVIKERKKGWFYFHTSVLSSFSVIQHCEMYLVLV